MITESLIRHARAPLFLLLPLLTLACGKTPVVAHVSGHVFLETQAGEVRRGAAAPVALIPASSSYQQVWRTICDSQTIAFRAAWLADSLRIFTEPDPSRAYRMLLAAPSMALERVARDREARFGAVSALAVSAGLTDVDGLYRLDSLQPGNYWLLSSMTLGNHPYEWFLPLHLAAGDSLGLDLNNANVRQRVFSCDDTLPPYPLQK